jgi:acylphosphatase
VSADGVADADLAASMRLTVWVRGQVQGVGFRWWTRARALELGLQGWAMNRPDGRVEVVAEGPVATLQTLLRLLQPDGPAPPTGGPPRPGHVTAAVPAWSVAKGVGPGFAER